MEDTLARLVMMEKELKEWWCPSVRHLKSLANIFEGVEMLKGYGMIIDQLFKIFLVIDEKKDCLQTLERWYYYEQFLSKLLGCELFQKNYKQDVIETIQNKVYGIQAFIKQEHFKDLLPEEIDIETNENCISQCNPIKILLSSPLISKVSN